MGWAGQLRHASALEAGEVISQQWRFFQPFQCAPLPSAPQLPHITLHCNTHSSPSPAPHSCITPAPQHSLQPLPEPLRITPCAALLHSRTAVVSHAVPL